LNNKLKFAKYRIKTIGYQKMATIRSAYFSAKECIKIKSGSSI